MAKLIPIIFSEYRYYTTNNLRKSCFFIPQYISPHFSSQIIKPMNGKIQSDDLERQATLDIDGISGSRNWVGGQYGEKKNRKKRNPIGNRLNTDHGKNSTYSSYSKLTSLIKGQSMAEADNFKATQSTYFNQLAQKYAPRGSPPEKIREQMELALQRKKSQIEALRVHRDELKFISYNNPYDMPIKMSLAVLKQKARTEQKIKDMMISLQKDIKEIEFQFNTMTDYYNFITNALKSNGEQDLIIDTQQEEKLMVENLEKQTNHLFKELKEEDKKNAKQIKNMQEQIAILRVYIKQKQDKIRDLKSMICTLHIKLHSRGSTSKEKSMSMSIRKFITEQNKSIQQAFIGNNSFKHYSKELLEKVNGSEQLHKLIFYYEPKKELISFKCAYKHTDGKLHSLYDQIFMNNNTMNTMNSPAKTKKQNSNLITTEIKLKYLLSMKFFFKSKIVGIQCRTKSEKGTQHIQIGNCSSNLQHELLTLINKSIVTLGSYWHQKDMIGVGVWYCNKAGTISRNTSTDSRGSNRIKTSKSPLNVNAETGEVLNQQYYNK